MGKKKQNPESDNEQVEDIMAWGKSKNNYYQQEQQQYSQASQEQDQAKQIYKNQYQHLNLNQQQFYQLPQHQQPDGDQDQQEIDQQSINEQFINNQILWVAQLAKALELIKDENYAFRKKVYDSYLLILMALKQFKIPYIDQHPLVQFMPLLKKTLRIYQSQLPQLFKKIKNQLEYQNNQQQVKQGSVQEQIQRLSDQDQNDRFEGNKQQVKNNKQQIKKSGLEIYENIRIKKQRQKKIKKTQRKFKRQQLPIEAFKTISQSEARLANQKILKNKGLMKRRSRGDGNSRVKLKYKYEKALIRRRAQGHVGVKQNPGRFYQGQNKVLYGKISSTKLK